MQRSNLEIINELDSRGELKPLILAGLFPAKILLHRDIYYFVAAKKECGMRAKEVIQLAEESFKINRSNIYRAIRGLK